MYCCAQGRVWVLSDWVADTADGGSLRARFGQGLLRTVPGLAKTLVLI